MSSHVVFDSKQAGSTEPRVFDFLSKLAVGETISGAAVTAAVYSGVDASPSAIVSGAATISGSQVSQKFTAGTVGVIYQLTCTVTTSSSNTLVMSAFLAVIPVVT